MNQPPSQIEAPRSRSDSPRPEPGRLKKPAFWLTLGVMLLFWLVFSGRFDLFHLSLGVVSCALVAWLSSDLLFADPAGRPSLSPWPRFILVYAPWLLWQIVLASVNVLLICLRPRMEAAIDPHLVRFTTRLESDLAKVTLANSITLTPGTITVRVDREGGFIVHALDAKSGDINALRAMEAQVARTFGEDAPARGEKE